MLTEIGLQLLSMVIFCGLIELLTNESVLDLAGRYVRNIKAHPVQAAVGTVFGIGLAWFIISSFSRFA